MKLNNYNFEFNLDLFIEAFKWDECSDEKFEELIEGLMKIYGIGLKKLGV